jgi:predicted oxidoreductase
MRTTTVGPNKEQVPVIIQGLMRTAHMSGEDLEHLLDVDMENGISYLDTSDIYSAGYCEQLLGQVFAERHGLRDTLVLQTKCGIRISPRGFSYYDFSEEYILKAAEASLKRLNTDRIDYYLLHRPDALFEPEDIASAFDKLKKSGKVRHFGVSNFNTTQLQYLNTCVSQPIEINQLQFSPAHTSMIDAGICTNRAETSSLDHDQGILNYCRLNHCTIQAWSPFRATKSIFTGGVIDRFGRGKIETRPYLDSQEFPELNARLQDFAEKYHVSPAAIVIAWILRHPAHMQVVLGSSKPERILDSCQGVDICLSREEWYEIYLAAGNFIP